MLQPSSAPSAPIETIARPDPGVARGKWEAPAWAFWLALAIILAVTTVYVLSRLGILKLPGRSGRGAGPP